MEPETPTPGTIVTHRTGEQPMVVLWVEPDGASVRCRWLGGTAWQEATLRIADLEWVETSPS